MPDHQSIKDFAAKLPPELREEFKRLMEEPMQGLRRDGPWQHIPFTGHLADKPFNPKHIQIKPLKK